MRTLWVTFFQKFLVHASFLAMLALALNVPDVPSGAEHHELYRVVASAVAPGASHDCAEPDHVAGAKQQHQQTDKPKCCSLACSVFGVLSSSFDIREPSVKGTPFVKHWSELFPSDPQSLRRPPKRLA